MVDVHYHSSLETTDRRRLGVDPHRSPGLEEDFHARYDKTDESSVLHFFAFDDENPSSVLSCLALGARERPRDPGQISGEMWEAINGWYLELREWDVAVMERKSAFDFFRRVKQGSHLFHGAAVRTQATGEARDSSRSAASSSGPTRRRASST